MTKNWPVAKDGLPYITGGVVATGLAAMLHPLAMILPGLLTAFFIFFFRNPRRTGPRDPSALVSPADGRVMSVTPVEHDPFLNAPAIRISIFLSLFNVHINRSPMDGRVVKVVYRPGKFLPAFKSHASEINERNTLVIAGPDATIAVHQITGFVARRIVCDVREGDSLTQRQRFGMIRFGSCTELILSPDHLVHVHEGDRVQGGLTILASKPESKQARQSASSEVNPS